MSSSATDSNQTAKGIALKSRKRAYLARGLRSAPTIAGLSLWIALIGACGLILDSLARARVEQKRILYLTIGAPHA